MEQVTFAAPRSKRRWPTTTSTLTRLTRSAPAADRCRVLRRRWYLPRRSGDGGLQLYTCRQGAHASNLGCVLALLLAKPPRHPRPSSILGHGRRDGSIVARVSGSPELPRKMQGHALNCRAMGHRCRTRCCISPADCRLIVLYRRRLMPPVRRWPYGRLRPRRRVDVRA